MKLYTLILDRSGSMELIWNEVTQALNNNLKDNIVIKRNKPLTNNASKEIDSFIE